MSSSQSSNPNFGNQEVHQRLIDDREFNLLEENNQQVILAKGNGNITTSPTNRGLSSFPTPPSGGRPSQPSRPATGRNPFIYRTTPKVVDPGLGGAANPDGAANWGKAPEFEENSQVPNKEQWQESKNFDYDYRSNDPQKKKKSKDQCPIDQLEVNEAFKSNSSFKKVTKRALGNQDVKREYTRILKRIGEGVDTMDIGRSSTDFGDGLTDVRGRHGRYIIKNHNGVKDVVGIAYRGARNDMKTRDEQIV